MSKKKGGKRLNKRMLQEMLQTLFQQNPNETFSFKQIFKALKFDTHPVKMMAIDLMEEMAWDDFLSKASDNSYRLDESGGQVHDRSCRANHATCPRDSADGQATRRHLLL